MISSQVLLPPPQSLSSSLSLSCYRSILQAFYNYIPRRPDLSIHPPLYTQIHDIHTSIWGIPRQIDQAETLTICFCIFIFLYVKTCLAELFSKKNVPKKRHGPSEKKIKKLKNDLTKRYGYSRKKEKAVKAILSFWKKSKKMKNVLKKLFGPLEKKKKLKNVLKKRYGLIGI